MSEQLLISVEDRICTLTINRPEKRNALNRDILNEILLVMTKMELEQDVYTVVIQGSGDRAFCAGLDLGSLSETRETDDGLNILDRVFSSIQKFSFPVIAMINGSCVGVGLELAMSCDLRIASNTAGFGMPPSKMGAVYNPESLKKFLHIIGPASAKELFITGRIISAAKAERIGLVNDVVPAENLEETVYGLAKEIVNNAPLAVKGHKYIINALVKNITNLDEEEAGKVDNIIVQAFNSADYIEGPKAFLEKRKPRFVGK